MQPLTLAVGGVTPLTSTDYPGHLSAVVFCQGCPWRCGFCHNPHLIPRRAVSMITWPSVRQFLERRRGLLDAVVFSGGEPTLQPGLAEAMREVKAMGYLVGLHTAGIVPRMLQRVLALADWVAMDLKAPFEEHEKVTRVAGSGRRMRESMALILASGVACRFHTIAGGAQIVQQAIFDQGQTQA